MTDRRTELAARLAALQVRIEAACAEVDRDPGEVTTVVVTKFFPTSDVLHLLDLGVQDIGENRDQEASIKLAGVRAARPDATVRLHFVGQLQTNKAGSVAGYADVVHAVDRPKLVGALDRAAGRAGRRLVALVQVSLDPPGAQGRAGVEPSGAAELADLVAAAEHLDLAGVMGVAPLGGDPDRAFAELARAARGIRQQHPAASWMSAGMSADLEAAIRHGATHLRVGTAILGSRQSLR